MASCRSGCGSAVSFSDVICVKGVNAIKTCGDGVPSGSGGQGCYAISLSTRNSNTVRLNQMSSDAMALEAHVRVGAAAANLIREVENVGLFAPNLACSDGSLIITEDTSGITSRNVSMNISESSGNGIEVIPGNGADSGVYVQEWVHEIIEVAGTSAHALAYSVDAINQAMAAGGEAIRINNTQPLMATYTNNSKHPVYVKFDVTWGGTVIRARDTAQRIEVNHVASMNFGALADIASSSSFGHLLNSAVSTTTDSYEFNFPRSSSFYVHTVPPGGTAQVTVYNTVSAIGQTPLTADTEDGDARDANAWGLAWGQPKIMITAISKAREIEQ